jgi:uncharacterized membrane protein
MKSALSNTAWPDNTVWSRAGWALAAAAVLGLLVAALLPPFVGPEAGAMLDGAFRHLCHQLPGRSFAVGGTPLAVCHRCTGIYAGLAGGALLFPFVRTAARRWMRHDRGVLLAAVLPATLDWGADVLGLWGNTVGTRVGTGLWLGLVVGVVFARSLSLRPKPEGADGAGEPVGAA